METGKDSYNREALGKNATVIAVASGKGGVGKTNIATNLAICLSASGKKVVVVDADLGLGNVDVLMNIDSTYNISHVVSGQKSIKDITQRGPGGVRVVCGGSGIEDLANLSVFAQWRLIEELRVLEESHDVIVLDTGAGINSSVVGFCVAADHTLVVTTPETTAMTDAYAMIKVLSGRGCKGKISLVVNMAGSQEEGRKIYEQIATVAKRFLDRRIFDGGVLCRDKHLPKAVKLREPVVISFPNSPITASMAAMTEKISNVPAVSSSGGGFARRVANWFF
jgi:flagellar biosynthesis protein FlhG